MDIIKAIILVCIFFSTTIIGCKPEEKKQDNPDINVDSIRISKQLSKANKIFYSLPAPHEVASILIEHPDAKYNEEILNLTKNASNYTTNKSMAINIGIFGADLSYASLFEQNQKVVAYMATIKKLSEQLGILGAFNETTLQKLEQNINNRDAIINTISETFMNSDAFLQENDRSDVAALIIVGGWIESMYIAIKLTSCDIKKNPNMVSRILEQQLSLSLMVNFLEDFKDNDNIKDILKDVKELNEIYETIETKISDNGIITTNQTDYTKLCKKIENLRDAFVKL